MGIHQSDDSGSPKNSKKLISLFYTTGEKILVKLNSKVWKILTFRVKKYYYE
jgi:hypothetical protein